MVPVSSTPLCSCSLFVGRGLAGLVPTTVFAPCSESAGTLALSPSSPPQPTACTAPTSCISVPCGTWNRGVSANILKVYLLCRVVQSHTDLLRLKSTPGTYGEVARSLLPTSMRLGIFPDRFSKAGEHMGGALKTQERAAGIGVLVPPRILSPPIFHVCLSLP